MRERARTLALYAPAAAVLAWCWLRLERPHAGAGTALWLIVLAVVPFLLPRRGLQLAALAVASALALHAAFGIWITHPLRLAGRFGHGFLEFYDVKLPFLALHHQRMEGVILVALFVSCAVVAGLIAAQRPVGAAFALLVAAGWPATLLNGPDDLRRGAVLLAVMLALVVGLSSRVHPRRLGAAVVIGLAVVAVAFGVSNSKAVASGQVLHWQKWDFYTKPQKPVGVEYVWNSDYRGLRFPKKVTTVLKIKAPSHPMYWRATTLDEFDGGNWFESAVPISANHENGRDELRLDDEFPQAASDSTKWVREGVTVAALRDNHLIAGSVPVAYATNIGSVDYAAGGVAYLQSSPLSPGDTYTAWSYQAQPKPQQLARLKPRYPRLVIANDLYIEARTIAPAFGTPGRDAKLQAIIRDNYRVRQYRRFYAIAKQVVGHPSNPYAAALELEAWFRSSGFRYDESPPPVGNVPPLVAFVTRTRAGYCQHFAGAMALMLRYLGIPARVAAGFTSGTYDDKAGEWRVTDHDAHTWVEAWFPRYGWLPFDPTPGRGNLDAPYTASSPHFDLSDGLLAVGATLKRQTSGFNLRKLRTPATNTHAPAKKPFELRRRHDSGSGLGALLKLLVLIAAAAALSVAVLKLVLRKRRYLTRDPRRTAAACVRELTDFIADQRVPAAPSATLHELAVLVEAELGVRADEFVSAAARARFGPEDGARRAARDARRELRQLLRRVRRSLSRSERALGVISLRSLGLTG
jgi:transglutaminase-like putative cysteine protease